VRTCSNNSIDRAVKIRKHVTSRNAQYSEPLRRQPAITPRVTLRPIPHLMRDAIDLNGNAWSQTREIQNIRPNRMLPPKAEPARSKLQGPPHQNFGQIPAASFLPRLLDDRARGGKHPTTTLRAVPLPMMGRYWRAVTHHHSTPPRSGEDARGADEVAGDHVAIGDEVGGDHVSGT
jgi:hypothetical protein